MNEMKDPLGLGAQKCFLLLTNIAFVLNEFCFNHVLFMCNWIVSHFSNDSQFNDGVTAHFMMNGNSTLSSFCC